MSGLRERKHLVLLLVLVLGLVFQPLAHGLLLGLVVYDVLLTLVLLAVFLVVFQRGWERFVALGVGLPTLVSNGAAHALSGGPRLASWAVYHCLVVAFLGFAVVVILRHLFQARAIRVDQVLGACCGYLLAGVAWGNLYVLAELLLPGSFRLSREVAWQLADEHTRRFLFNYFSFATLTTLGYADVTPVGPPASTLTWLEAVFGQFYLAVVVAQLVGLKLAQAVGRAEPGPQ
jgi:voltage-gated potassium channel